MKTLSGYAEWFWLMAKNIKPVENRDWSLFKYIKREQLPLRIYLHASKTKASKDEIDFIRRHLTTGQLHAKIIRDDSWEYVQKLSGRIVYKKGDRHTEIIITEI